MLNRIVADILPRDRALPRQELERRSALRVDIPFPATVRGIDAAGRQFQIRCHLDNLSACGLYTRLDRPVMVGTRLLFVIRLAVESSDQPAPVIAVRSSVMRTELHPDGSCGIAAMFVQHRFLYSQS